MNNPELSPADLEAFMKISCIPGEILYLETLTPTVEAAARAVGSRPERIVKSILFLVDGQPVLTIACGLSRVDSRALARQFGVGRKRVKLAPAETVLEISGYQVGAMPPFGHRIRLQTFIDGGVLEQPEVYAGGGADNALIHLDPQTILQVTQGQVLDLLDQAQEDSADQES